MLNNQPFMQIGRGSQSPIASQLMASSKFDEGQQSFEAKLSEHIDSSNGEKKSMKVDDNLETSEAVPPVPQSMIAIQPPAAAGKNPSLTNAKSAVSSQPADLPRLVRARTDSGIASLREYDTEAKSSKRSSLEGVDAQLMLGANGLASSPFEALAVSGGAGVSTHTLMLATMAPDLSTKNSPSIFEVQLTTPLSDPHFEGSFASQISFLTSQGLSQAKIHLNPQDMGPVSVDIHSVGDTIEVSFQAAREQTRQAIEASIDTLRGLMRDEGMTLQNAVVRTIEVAPPQAMAASSEQRSNDFQFDRASQFEGFAKNSYSNSRDQSQFSNSSVVEADHKDILPSAKPSVGLSGAMNPTRLTRIDLFA